eukprot:TRINITY_DN88408_c0_g1_i1.p1 TRINITY_DN88408_c0_g1~~TRINITY_DN88408_c0_g1_i1.p1  ORF type:complete len:175 (+),score=9.51 TRINITY_DN88408_c0_g1_i1:49-525(+)
MYASCIKDKCGIVVCNNGGVCVDGTCTCPTGYEGTSCSKMWNEKFSGRWNVSDSMAKTSVAGYKYEISVDGLSAKDSFYINGFADTMSVQVLCRKTAYRIFAFTEQKIDSFLTIKGGTGTLDSTTGIVYGNYSFLRKIPQAGGSTKDTTVTVYFSWKR